MSIRQYRVLTRTNTITVCSTYRNRHHMTVHIVLIKTETKKDVVLTGTDTISG
jgi:hypothetical protein